MGEVGGAGRAGLGGGNRRIRADSSDSRVAGYRTVVMAKYSGSTPGGHLDAFAPFASSPPPPFLPPFLPISRGRSGMRAVRFWTTRQEHHSALVASPKPRASSLPRAAAKI